MLVAPYQSSSKRGSTSTKRPPKHVAADIERNPRARTLDITQWTAVTTLPTVTRTHSNLISGTVEKVNVHAYPSNDIRTQDVIKWAKDVRTRQIKRSRAPIIR
jgi:hypothetical protein